MTSSVASSTRVWAGCSPSAIATTSSAADLGHLHQRLTDGRQRRADPLRDRQVVEPDDAEVFGDVEPELAGRLVDAERLQVVAGEDGRRAVGSAQQRAALLDALVDVEPPWLTSRGSIGTSASSIAAR